MPLNSTSAWPADDVGDRLRAAFVGDVGPLRAGAQRELDAREMRRAADRRGGVVELARLRLRVARSAPSRTSPARTDAPRGCAASTRPSSPARNPSRDRTELRVDARADRERADVGEQHRVAVGRALRDELRADVAVRARACSRRRPAGPSISRELRPKWCARGCRTCRPAGTGR